MGMYLCVFAAPDRDDELGGVEVGGYDDFDRFRRLIGDRLEGGRAGSRFPVLMLHHDSDGTWEPSELTALRSELTVIRGELEQLAPAPFDEGWQSRVAREFDLRPSSLAESIIDVDGQVLLDRLLDLCSLAIETRNPIWFQ